MNWDYVKKFEQFYTWWVGGVMDSTLVFDTRGPGFDSRSLQILLTSFFLLCQVLYKTNFPCMYKKTTSTLFYVPSFVQNKFPLHINIKLSLWMYKKTTSAFLENAATPATAGLRARWPLAAWRARRVGINIPKKLVASVGTCSKFLNHENCNLL